MPAVHQFAVALAPGDAVSNHVLALRALFREWGYRSGVYAVEVKREVADVEPYRRLFRAVRPDDLLILHVSTGHEAFEPISRINARRVVIYHNITPPEFFDGLNPHAALQARLGRRQLRHLAAHVDLAIGVSEFNRRELEAAGYARTAVVPLLVDWRSYDVAPDPSIVRRSPSGPPALLFVGRIAPQKRQDDLIRVLAYFRRCINPEARLSLVGSYRDQPRYYEALRALARALDVDRAVAFTGEVSVSALVAYYRSADCFLSLSEHEGFGVPLLEAMRFGVPVVAHAAAAIGETADGAAILLHGRDLAEAAETCAVVIEQPELRNGLVAAGSRRVAEFARDRVAARTREVLGL